MQTNYKKNELSARELQLLASEMDNRKKSTAIAYLIWIFFGGVGGHRYYLGKYGTAILMTFTLGGLGVWTLIDLFLISPMLKKKNSEIESEIINEIVSLNHETYNCAKNAKPQTNIFTFRTAGITKKNDQQKDIQSTLQRYAKKYCYENDIDMFGGYSNKEILEDPSLIDGVNEFYDLVFDNEQIIFIPEPDNPYDNNAIKIYLDFDFDQLHIGYVPKKYTKTLMNIINTKKVVSFEGKILGGNIKEMVMDDYTDKWKIEKTQLSLGLEINIIYTEE